MLTDFQFFFTSGLGSEFAKRWWLEMPLNLKRVALHHNLNVHKTDAYFKGYGSCRLVIYWLNFGVKLCKGRTPSIGLLYWVCCEEHEATTEGMAVPCRSVHSLKARWLRWSSQQSTRKPDTSPLFNMSNTEGNASVPILYGAHHTAILVWSVCHVQQQLCKVNRHAFITPDLWPPNSHYLNPVQNLEV